jgi:hypothetical protein
MYKPAHLHHTKKKEDGKTTDEVKEKVSHHVYIDTQDGESLFKKIPR